MAVCTAQDDTFCKRHACTTLTQQHPQDMWGRGLASHSTMRIVLAVPDHSLQLPTAGRQAVSCRLSQWQLIHNGSALFLLMLLHLQIRRTFL